jgi:hypothetical protein
LNSAGPLRIVNFFKSLGLGSDIGGVDEDVHRSVGSNSRLNDLVALEDAIGVRNCCTPILRNRVD